MYFLKTLQFQYGSMGGKPTGYHYDKCKDKIKWLGYKAKDFIPLIDLMFNSFVGGIKSK